MDGWMVGWLVGWLDRWSAGVLQLNYLVIFYALRPSKSPHLRALYEVTLGVPGMWWGYQKEPMIGLFIASWHGLPIEAVTLWFAAVFMTVLVFEAIKIRCFARNPRT
jgi:hypothetical protein